MTILDPKTGQLVTIDLTSKPRRDRSAWPPSRSIVRSHFRSPHSFSSSPLFDRPLHWPIAQSALFYGERRGFV